MTLYPLSRSHLRLALLVGALALIIRLVFVAVYPVNIIAGSDSTAYWSFAQGIADGRGFRSDFEPWVADRPPLYSYFLAGLFAVVGENRTAVFVVQAVLGAVAAALFCLCAMRLLGTGRGLFGGLLFAILPHFLIFTQQILTEGLFLLLFVAVLAVLLLPEGDKFRGWQWALIGILLGLIALEKRETVAPVGVLTLLLLYFRLKPRGRWMMQALALTAVFAGLVILPWILRNWQVLGKPVFSSSGGINFLVGNNPDARGEYTPAPDDWQPYFDGLTELERDSMAWNLSLTWIRENPNDFLALLPMKLVAMWEGAHNAVIDGAELLLIPLYLLGILRILRRQENWQIVTLIVVLLLLTTTLINLVFVGGWRYRVGVYPGLLLLAAYGLPGQWLERRLSGLGLLPG